MVDRDASAGELPELTPEEFNQLFDAAVAELKPQERAILAKYAVPTFRAEHEVTFVRCPVWVVAESGGAVLGYDEVEEEYGNGTLRAGGLVEDWGTYGERLPLSVVEFQRLVEFRRS